MLTTTGFWFSSCLTKAYQPTTGRDPKGTPGITIKRMQAMNGCFMQRIVHVFIGLLCIYPSLLLAEYQLDLKPGVTPVSQQIYSLHTTIFIVCCVIGLVVFGVMFYSIFRYRKSAGAKAAHFHENTTVEVIWTLIPLAILIGMAIPATKTLLYMEDASESDIDIQVTGYQWKWKYHYLDSDISFFSNLATPQDQINNKAEKQPNYLLEVDNPLVIPTGKKVRFLFTAADVIHSWWVPALGVKKDAIPGFINEAWATIEEPGIYRGQCTELCGVNHGFMPVVIDARSESDYQEWVGQQLAAKSASADSGKKTWTMADLMKQGQQVYATNCQACHQPTGLGIPGAFPSLVDTPLIKGPIDKHLDIVYNGKAGTAMQAFGAQLSDVDIAAVITYERNAWGNQTGELVQPSDIAQFKATNAK